MLCASDLPCSHVSLSEAMLVVDAITQQLDLCKSFSRTLLMHNHLMQTRASATIGSILSHAGWVEPLLEFSCISTKEPNWLLRNLKMKKMMKIKKKNHSDFFNQLEIILTELSRMPNLENNYELHRSDYLIDDLGF